MHSACESPLVTCQLTRVGTQSTSVTRVFLGYLGTCDGTEIPDPAKLIDIDAKIGTCVHEAIGIDRRKVVFGNQPIHEVRGGGLDREVQGTISVDRDEAVGFLDPDSGNPLFFD